MAERRVQSGLTTQKRETKIRIKSLSWLTEYALLGTLILVLWGSMTIPTVVFFVPFEGTALSASCSQELYTGTVCYSVLQSYHSCTSGLNTTDVYISPVTPQEEIEVKIASTSDSLYRVNASTDCAGGILQLLCTYYYGICSEDGDIYLPSREECAGVISSVGTCGKEVNISMLLSDGITIPECDNLSPGTISKGKGNVCMSIKATQLDDQLPEQGSGLSEFGTANSTPLVRECSSDFYLEESTGLCHPECSAWTSLEEDTEMWLKPLAITTAVVQILGAAVFYLLSCANYKQMFSFPSVYILITEVCILAESINLLFQYLAESSYFCESRDYLHAHDHPAVTCVVASGAVHFFNNLGFFMWVAHVAAIFFAIKFPFKHVEYKAKGYMKYIYATLTALAILIACVLTATWCTATMITTTLPFQCEPANPDIVYLTNTLPLTIAINLGGAMLLVIFGELLKVAFYNCRHSGSKTWPNHLTKAQLKIIGSFVTYFGFALCLLTASAIIVAYRDDLNNDKSSYFACELKGRTLRGECQRQSFEITHAVRLIAATYVISAGYPLINTSYALNLEEIRKFKENLCKRLRTLSNLRVPHDNHHISHGIMEISSE